MGYSAALSLGAGDPASTAPNVTNQNHNVGVADARADKSTLHWAIAIVVLGVVILSVGRGYLRNARIA